MKKTFYLAVFFFVMSTAVHAQSKDEKEVAAAVEQLDKAIVDGDSTILKNITTEGLSYGHSSGKVENKTQFIEGVIKGADFLNIDISEQTITMAGDNAIVRHIFSAKLQNNGITSDIRIGNLLVWQKQKGKWKLLARQAYKL